MTTATVIIPVYNGADFVAAAIDSALAQTLRDCRIIAVDDGSTDAAPAVLAGFGSRIRVIRHENRGLSAARNGALALADSEYVAFLDHDDLWEPTFLERGTALLAAAPDRVAGAVAGWVRIDRDGRELPGTGVAPRGSIGLRELVLGNRFACGAVVLRRRALVESGGFDATLRAVEDWDLWLRLAVCGWEFATVDACLWRYRLHGSNLSNDPDLLRQNALRVLENLFAHPGLPADVLACRDRAVANAFLHSSEALYAGRRETEARRDFAAGVQTCPDLLEDDETYYSIVCAEQPPGYKASPFHLDLMAGQERILEAVSTCRDGGLIDAALHRRALGRAYRALAALAFGQRRMRDVRHYAGCALRADAALWRDRRTLVPALKSLAGAQLVDAVSRWRHRAGTRTRSEAG